MGTVHKISDYNFDERTELPVWRFEASTAWTITAGRQQYVNIRDQQNTIDAAIPGPVFIASSGSLDLERLEHLENAPEFDELEVDRIYGLAILVELRPFANPGRWREDQHIRDAVIADPTGACWIIGESRPFVEPIPCFGDHHRLDDVIRDQLKPL